MCHLDFQPVVMVASDDASAQSIPWAESSIACTCGIEFKLMHLDGSYHPLVPVEAAKLTGSGGEENSLVFGCNEDTVLLHEEAASLAAELGKPALWEA